MQNVAILVLGVLFVVSLWLSHGYLVVLMAYLHIFILILIQNIHASQICLLAYFCVILFSFQKGVRPVHIKMEIFVVSSYYSFFLIDYSSLSFLIEATCIYGEQPNDPCPCFSCQNGLTCLSIQMLVRLMKSYKLMRSFRISK